jgi:adenosyl cobinamide kinase/adenosyl cobinamide phosphate guanylyltransferase
VNNLKTATAQSSDPEMAEQVNQHIASLEAALQTVSNMAQVPIQVYSSGNQLVGSFSPGG